MGRVEEKSMRERERRIGRRKEERGKSQGEERKREVGERPENKEEKYLTRGRQREGWNGNWGHQWWKVCIVRALYIV